MHLRPIIVTSKEKAAIIKAKIQLEMLKTQGLTNTDDVTARIKKMAHKDEKKFNEAPLSALLLALCDEIKIEKGLMAPPVPKKKKKKNAKNHNPQTTAVEETALNQEPENTVVLTEPAVEPKPAIQFAVSPLTAIDKIYAMVYEDAKEAPTFDEILKLKSASREKLWDFFQYGLTKGKAGLFIQKFKECGAFDALFPAGAEIKDPRDIFYKKFIEGFVSVQGGYQQFGTFAVKKDAQEPIVPSVSLAAKPSFRAN